MKFTKTLAGMEDMLCVPGQVVQTRGGKEVLVQGIDLHFSVSTEEALSALDYEKYPRV